MEEVQAILDQCSTEWACTTRQGADRIVFRLEECRNYLTTMLNSTVTVPVLSTEVQALMELHVMISQLMIMWEQRLDRLDSTAGGGRPRKYVNIPLVSSVSVATTPGDCVYASVKP